MDATDRMVRITGDIIAKDPQAFYEALPFMLSVGLGALIFVGVALYFTIKKSKKN
ncbi:MAG: hypothetical protein UR60_C0002G0011 [Candidatus Moranbacteria bacterium GW2011_GWF2_34_56]|nr:MAG: hypothetical protein UR51_C0009G0060 [Candidatus Moranbacteria bacterium GW2011_GWF1_34_10]KKP65359.1 MAG: hypothetical protein UR60_C0002G0011 [Candidatus Moranbacteria bacterium GW2011_GWF2_34_56]